MSYRAKRRYTAYNVKPSKRFKAYKPVRASVPQSAQIAAAMRAAANREKKGMDTDLTLSEPILSTVNTNANAFTLNLVQQGAGSWNRIGRKISMQSVRLRGQFTYEFKIASSGSLDVNSQSVRMVVVYDKQPSGSLPTFDTIFGNTNQSGTESCDWMDSVRYDNMDRFQVLRDCVFDFETQVASSTVVRLVKSFDEFISLKGKETVFSGQSSPMTIADISSGGLYVYFRSAGNSTPTDNVNAAAVEFGVARLRYTD